MTKRQRVLAAMSGGVDSSVAAARLVDAGYDVIGVTLHLWDYPEGAEPGRCCAPEDQYDARAVCDELGIPHYTFDRRELFAREVVSPFVDAYLDGSTPSPCVHCNRSVKLNELFAIADRLGALGVATGHYARTEARPTGAALLRGRDRQKDQSYFLHTMVLKPHQLERLILPLGEATKDEVRTEAVARRLTGATKGESQELCFVPTGRYDAFVKERAPNRVRPGPIVDDRGRVVGTHEGIHGFTIGQRKGLGVALGQPMFVAGLDSETSTVRLGKEADLYAAGAILDEGVFAPDVELPISATIQVRARHSGAAGVVARSDAEGLGVRFDEPVRAVSPGQVAVLYDGERVLGGATIRRALPAAALAMSLALGGTGCSLGEGTGDVKSTSLFATDCWNGSFDLKPDFFAAVPSRNTLYIREQRGSDFQGVSDGVTILVDDVADTRQNHLGQPIPVTLPRGIAPPGIVPGTLCGSGCSDIHLTLFLLHSCFNENTVLYGISGTVTFNQLFDGDPTESDAAKKLTEGTFDVMVGNPQNIDPSTGTIPKQSELKGTFRFFFQRGQPAQPFP